MNIIEYILSIFGGFTKSTKSSNTSETGDTNEDYMQPTDIGASTDPMPLIDTPISVATPVVLPSKRKWRLTYYYISEQSIFKGPKTVPVYTKDGILLEYVEPAYFAQMSLEGTGKMRDGRLFNVAGVFVNVKHEDYAAVYEHHKKYLAKRPAGYSGLVVKNDKVVAASSYHLIASDKIGLGYGTLRGIPLEPFRTLAADIGRTKRSEPKWKGKDGVCPPLTKVFIEAFVGVKCPDSNGGSFVHDGWFIVNDTGGGIFGKHFDIFVGTKSLVSKVRIPSHANISYEEIDERVPNDNDYTYGLYDV